MRIDQNDLYWLIGILEGEGTFLAGPPSSLRSPVVRVEMTDRDIVERVGRILARSVVAIPPREAHYKPPYATMIKGSPAVELMQATRPLMGASRQRQIDRAIASWHGRPSRWLRLSETCNVQGCSDRPKSRGLCKRHYDQWWKARVFGRRTLVEPSGPAIFASDLPVTATPADELALHWLAGLLEGEGTFTATRQSPTSSYPVIKLQMCAADIVGRAAGLLGAANVGRREPRNERWSPTYVATITGHHAAVWMRLLRPLMGHRRSLMIDDALAGYVPIRLIDAPKTCVVAGCDDPHEARGLCHKHYMMWSRDRAMGREQRITPLR